MRIDGFTVTLGWVVIAIVVILVLNVADRRVDIGNLGRTPIPGEGTPNIGGRGGM